ncbi:calcium and integrin-binding protein 1 isoform X2 [Manis pentadactyla]|uniref:calcium and integrin-binding protein 1 isoform X2 n=1 Tax=Manis pentadactyla TaxID=143292 RepID=UPI00255C9F8C|nr:calcium and integrin-binding protein 1 isoform X2 [Manis pentadactyla]
MRRPHARTRLLRPAPPTRRRGREAWAPGRSIRPRPGPRLQLARDRPEPGASGRNRAGSTWELEGGDGPGGGGPRSGCRGDGTVTPLEGGSEKVTGVPGRVGGAVLAAMGGSGSRLSKDLLAEYQDLTFLTKQEILLPTPSGRESAGSSLHPQPETA